MSTASQIIDTVRHAIEDPKDQFFDLSDYVRAYNDALDEISELTEINESYVYVKRRKNSLYTDLRGIMPPTFLRITSVYNPHTEKWLDPTTVRELDSTLGRHWDERVDYSRWWFMRGLWFLGTYPIASDDISPLKVWYTAMLPHAVESGGLTSGITSSADLPPDYSPAIENYMMYTLLGERKEVEKSLEYYKRFVDQVGSLRNLAENRMRRDRTPRIGARR